jgi:predicted nucleic acid-binding protein
MACTRTGRQQWFPKSVVVLAARCAAGDAWPLSVIIMIKISSDLKIWKYGNLFLDTCALVKLLVPEFKEPGTETLRTYLEASIQIHTSDYCIGETLGILKRKWLSKKESPQISTDGYLVIINRLNWKINNNKIKIHKISLSKYFDKSIDIVKNFKIDYVDALLLNYAIEMDKKALFVTADSNLAKACQELGVLYWNILDRQEPQ